MVIVCVDDDELVRSVISDMLRELSHFVLEFSDALTALSWMSTQRSAVDLLLTDIRMPGMTGFTFAREAKKRHPDLDIIFISAYAEGISASDPIIRKPCTLGGLETALRHASQSSS
ncbi:response regulator transcription factor [Rhizorhabdus phycosphaerae]|uniref:response regulator transcription factor n=1 Tax=Rhizorhabdus phycosphaerae TaxID=2711156 RepID=UPI001D012AF4|nr:response regulator [Rhizorhabdus phycosphaerae]